MTSISAQGEAIVDFSEGAVWQPTQTIYEVNLNIKDMQATPGFSAQMVAVGDTVQVQYSWADMHYLTFLVNPYIGAESLKDGSVVGSKGLTVK